MKQRKFIKCNVCDMEYEIIWDNAIFSDPILCVGCGTEDPDEEFPDTPDAIEN